MADKWDEFSERLRDLEAQETILTGAGGPAINAAEGTIYWDITNDDLYVNDDGAAGWTFIGGGGGAIPHNLLNGAVHPDTVAQGATRGSLVYGNATPAWDELVHPGAANRVLQSAAADVQWSANQLILNANLTVTTATTLVGGGNTLTLVADLTNNGGAANQVAYWSALNTLAGENQLALSRGGTAADLSATGGANQYVQQAGVGAAFTVGPIAAAAIAHNILDGSVHSDSAIDGVTRGSIIIGNSTPLWDELVIGGAGTYLRSDGADPSWQNIQAADITHNILDGSVHSDSAVDAVTRGSIIIGNATPLWDELVHPGGANRVLQSSAADVQWSVQTLTLTTSLTNQGANGVLNWAGAFTLTIPATGTATLGTGANTQVTYWTGVNTVSGDPGFTYDAVNDAAALTSSISALPRLRIENTNADSSGGRIEFYKNSASPADNDNLGTIEFYGEDSASNKDRFAYIVSRSVDVTSTDEAGSIVFLIMMDSTLRNMLEITGYNGVVDQGTITFNQNAQDVDLYVEAAGVADALFIQGSDGQVTLGALGAGFVRSNAGGVLSSSALIAGDLPAHTHSGAGQGGSLVVGTTDTDATAGSVLFAGVAGVIQENNANFFWDDTNNRLGIGITPSYILHTSASSSALGRVRFQHTGDGSSAQVLDLYHSTSSPAASDDVGRIKFIEDDDAAAETVFGEIIVQTVSVGSGSEDGLMKFNAIVGGVETTHLVLVNGRVGIGDGSPDAPLDVYHATTDIVAFFESADDIGGIKVADDDTTGYVYAADGYVFIGGDAAKAATNLVVNATTGYTGIGIAAPAWPLDVRHATVDVVAHFASSDDIGGIMVADNDTVGYVYAADGVMFIGGNIAKGTNNLVVDIITGYAGIGDITPDAPLDVRNSSVDIVGFFESADDIGGIKVMDDTTTGYVYAADSYVFVAGNAAKAITSLVVNVTTGYVGTGTVAPGYRVHASEADAVTATITDVALLEHVTSGTAAVGFGAGLLYYLEDDSGTSRDAGRLAFQWGVAATATRRSELVIDVAFVGGALQEVGVLVASTGSSVAGNQRGAGAIDFGTFRGAATEVASGQLATISGGGRNTVTQLYGVIGGGWSNSVTASSATIAGGTNNTISGSGGSIGGGDQNDVNSAYGAICGGDQNTAGGVGTGQYTGVLGGSQNTASGDYASVLGGLTNDATGDYAATLGGASNLASGTYAVAAGYDAHATHTNSMVFSATAAQTLSWANDSFTVRCHGGARFYSAAGVGTGVQLSAGGNAWAAISDRAVKENIVPANGVLERLDNVGIYDYNLIAQSPDIRHIGPIAQEFNPAFGFTEDAIRINVMDAIGVSLAAIKELDTRTLALERRMAQLEIQ